MSVKIIKTAERLPYREKYLGLVEKYLSSDFPVVIPPWIESPFYFCNSSFNEDGSAATCSIMVLTNETTFKKLVAGEIHEHEMPTFVPGEYGLPYLYWSTLIVENRQHAPYLMKSIFGEISNCARKWELMITHVYAVAFTKISEKLLRRYYFTQAGTYHEHGHAFPIMISKVKDNPYLRAFLPTA